MSILVVSNQILAKPYRSNIENHNQMLITVHLRQFLKTTVLIKIFGVLC